MPKKDGFLQSYTQTIHALDCENCISLNGNVHSIYFHRQGVVRKYECDHLSPTIPQLSSKVTNIRYNAGSSKMLHY